MEVVSREFNMEINPKKCGILQPRDSQNWWSVEAIKGLKCHDIPEVNEYKYLGVLFPRPLPRLKGWPASIMKYNLSRVLSKVGVIRHRLARLVNNDYKYNLARTYFLSKIRHIIIPLLLMRKETDLEGTLRKLMRRFLNIGG